ncbi:MAG: hypothetical protein CMP14_07630 [Rickettsiales bacterium]|nr:hypothetical protein [Rickettsiales bacterium]
MSPDVTDVGCTGGKSTGPRTAEGKARAAAAHTKHGRRSAAHVSRVKFINADPAVVITQGGFYGITAVNGACRQTVLLEVRQN